MKSLLTKRTYVATVAIIVWFALGLQLKLSVGLLNGDFVAALKLILSYFTVLSNILVAICLTFIILFKDSRLGLFFNKSSIQTAITISILVVGLIYNVALRGLATPAGLHRLADELLHVVSPLLFLGYWIFFVDKTRLEYKSAILWLSYPLLYVLFIVTRGYFINQYPYPFIDVTLLGYPKAILNTAIILVVFWLLSLLFIFLARQTRKI